MARRSGLTDTGTAIGKIYPQDRHGPGHPHHSAKPQAVRVDISGKPARDSNLEKIKPGTDMTGEINQLYAHGRFYPREQPHDRPRTDLAVPELSAPGQEPASYRQGTRPHDVSPALSEQAPQFTDEKHAANYDNDASGWVRGMAASPHPHSTTGRAATATTQKRDGDHHG